MDITLTKFQIKAIADLTAAMEPLFSKTVREAAKPLYSLILWTSISKVTIK